MRDSFNAFIVKNTTRIKNEFDLGYLTDFNRYLWNEQKHQWDISLSAMVYSPDNVIMPKLRARGRFGRVNLETFVAESLDSLIDFLKFIHSRF